MMKSFTEQPARKKAFYYVPGANHNYWNTEWQFSDSTGCFDPSLQLFETDPTTGILPGVTGSARQRTTGSASILALVRGVLSRSEDSDPALPHFLTNFNPLFQLPAVVTSVARIQRGFITSPNATVTTALDDFDQATGASKFGVPNDTSNVTVEHVAVNEHGIPFTARDAQSQPVPLPAFLRAGLITWQRGGADVFFQINFTNPGGGLDLSNYRTLDFRIDRETPVRTNLNPAGPTNFNVQLVAANGTLSKRVAVSRFIELVGPFGTPDADLTFINPALPDGYHLNMQTVRIPLDAFQTNDLKRTRGIRLTFDDTPTGKIYVTNFRASRRTNDPLEDPFATSPVSDTTAASNTLAGAASGGQASGRSPRVIGQGNVIESVQFVPATGPGAAAAVAGNGTVRLTVFTNTPIPVGNELPIMSVGSVQCDGSYVDGSTQRMRFECPAQALLLADGAQITVRSNARAIWNFGAFSRRMVK